MLQFWEKKRPLAMAKPTVCCLTLTAPHRESTNRAIYGLLGKDGEVFSSALRSICNDWVAVSKRRKYASPMESSLISNDTEEGIIANLLKTIEEGAGTYGDILSLKQN